MQHTELVCHFFEINHWFPGLFMSCQLYFHIINFQCKQNVHNSKSHIIIIRGQRMKEIFQLYLNIWCSYVTTSGNQQTGAWWISFGHISHYPSTPVLKCVAAIKCLANICNEMVKCLNLNIWYVLHLLLRIKCRFVWFYLHFLQYPSFSGTAVVD